MKTCKQCQKGFEVIEADRVFYNKIDVPEPNQCPDCRLQQRICWRNERIFYPRICDSCKKNIISIFAPNTGYTVYCSDCWWGDAYDPLEYGREYHSGKPFFEQFAELDKTVPKLSIFHAKSTNCDYTNYCAENKDCYLLVGSLGCENCYYSYRIFYSKDVVDCYDVYKGELCYQCVECKNLYGCIQCKGCRDSNNLNLCENCTGCNDCFGCINLRSKQYHIFNKPYPKEEYEKKSNELKNRFEAAQKEFSQLRLSAAFKASDKINCTNSTGDGLLNCKECHECFLYKNSENCSYAIFGDNNKDSGDINFGDNCELQYNSSNLEKNYNVICTALAWYCTDAAYCSMVFNSNNIFGCSALKKQEYCILNKQYSKDEYFRIRNKIVESLKHSGEWGDFLPASISTFAYNESIASEYFPLDKKLALARGLRWQENLPFTSGKETIDWGKIPADIKTVNESICKEILACVETGKNFRIIKQELEFYKKMDVALPRLHPDVRFANLRSKINPHKLWYRQCANCARRIETTYSPDRPEKVFCEECYQKEVA